MSAGWANYDEKHPFGKGALTITPDNHAASRTRYRAQRAVVNGTATPEQSALVYQIDADMQRIIAEGV